MKRLNGFCISPYMIQINLVRHFAFPVATVSTDIIHGDTNVHIQTSRYSIISLKITRKLLPKSSTCNFSYQAASRRCARSLTSASWAGFRWIPALGAAATKAQTSSRRYQTRLCVRCCWSSRRSCAETRAPMSFWRRQSPDDSVWRTTLAWKYWGSCFFHCCLLFSPRYLYPTLEGKIVSKCYHY